MLNVCLRHRSVFALLVPVFVAASPLFAQSFSTPPSWRGGAYSTYQEWTFTAATGLGAPNVLPFSNSNGTPDLYTQGNAAWGPFASVPPPSSIGTNMWQLTSATSGLPSSICTNENNHPIDVVVTFGVSGGPDPIRTKDDETAAWFFGAVPVVSVLPIAGHGDFTVVETARSITTLPSGWSRLQVSHSYYTTTGISPSAELILFSAPAGDTTWIAGVSVDTQVVPTPGAGMAAMLGVGGVFAAGRRRCRV